MLTKYVAETPDKWDEELDKCLWAYRISFKVHTSFTPFDLVYGQEAIVPIQAQLGALRSIERCQWSQEEQVQARIHQLEVIQFNRETALDYYIQQANQRAGRLNAKVKKKDIHEGSLVMMYNSKLDSTFQTKLQPKWLGPFRVVCAYANGSYQLEDMEGKLLKHYDVVKKPHHTMKLKLFFVR